LLPGHADTLTSVAEIKPFQAIRYDERRAGPLEPLVAPPYDVIGPEERRDYLARSPYNVVHLTLPDSERQAARDFASWRQEGVLVEDAGAALWSLEQDYVGPDGVRRIRRGLIAALHAEPYDRRVVLPHERTHAGPKAGRLRLLRAVRAQLEPIFLLYEARPPLDFPTRPPDLEAEGSRLWRIPDDGISDWFANQSLLIADGHHRYETTLSFADEGGSPWMLAVLVSTDDPGLEIFPTHRVAKKVNGAFPASLGRSDPKSMLATLERNREERASAVVYLGERGAGYLHGKKGELDVELVEPYVREVTYTASAGDAIAAVDEGRAEAAFLVRPLRVEDVFARAARGEVMPEKSTYFYPKLLSGLLFLPLASLAGPRSRPAEPGSAGA
jgi:uncharacterized protein (DUF1015 family)